MRRTIGLVGSGPDAYPRDAEQIAALPYAQLGVRQGDGARGILVLSEVVEDEQSWVSADRSLIVTRGNRIVRTRGMASDLRSTARFGPDLWDLYDPATGVADGGDFLRLMRLVPDDAPAVMFRSRFVVEGPETISLLGQSIDTLRVREDLDVDVWRWRATNHWWLSLQGKHAWRSRQHLSRDVPPLELELLKRPA
ncbi:MAG: YjbF family lipoprotein [Panacagrimonas sp.]